jgi:hypothetical protein
MTISTMNYPTTTIVHSWAETDEASELSILFELGLRLVQPI